MEREYTLNELQGIKNALEQLIKKSAQSKFNKKLVYSLHKNLRIVAQELEDINKVLNDMPEGYNEYVQKLQQTALENGATANENGVSLEGESFDKAGFDAAKGKLDEEYTETIEKTLEVQKENEKLKKEAMAQVTWHPIYLDTFPDEVDYTDMPFPLIDLIEE